MTKRNKLMDKMTEALDLLEGIESTLIIILESYEYRDKMNEDDIKVKHSLSLVVIDTKKKKKKNVKKTSYNYQQFIKINNVIQIF